MSFTPEQLRACIEVLEALARDKRAIYGLAEEDRIALLKAAGIVAEPDKALDKTMSRQQRRTKKKELRKRDRDRRERTGIREARRPSVFVAPPLLDGPASEGPELEKPLNCYVCKQEYTKFHHFYDSMCPPCAELNYAKRFQTAPLPGRTAIVTGARVKIGYHCALNLLRAGARVI
ncbi:MAG: oxidoreductase, partial [Planctomycetota bacterium]